MKNLLFLAITLFAVAQVRSQLYVSPNGGADSYVYVNDEILFVEQDINLIKNTTLTEESSLYLRNEAQLIQGASNSANAGNGSISVLQNTPESDAWDYTYWSAPVGRPHVSLTGNRSFDANLLNDYITEKSSEKAIFTNALNGIESPFTISRRWIYRHLRGLEEESSYEHIGNSWNLLQAGIGYTMKGVGTSNHDQVYDFRGRPHNGTIDISVYDGEYTLSGNPYPSAIDLNALFYDADNSEIFQFLYWDEDHGINSHNYSDNRGGYGTYVPGSEDPGGTLEVGTYVPAVFQEWNSGGTGSGTGASGALYNRRFAPIGQGFMIEPNASGDGIVKIKNAFRRYIKEGNASDFRSTDGTFTDPNAHKLPQIRFNTYFGESHARQMVLLFSNKATDGFDRGLDGKSPLDASSEIYFPIDSDDALIPLVISTVRFELDKLIPLTIKVNDAQYDVQLEIVEDINFGNRVYLFDNVANTYQPIYNGNISSTILNPGLYKDRFFLTFQNREDSSTIVKEASTIARNAVKFFQNNPARQLEVSNPEGYDIKEASIFDMSGKLVYSEKNVGNDSRLTFPTYNFSDGVYLVTLHTADNTVIDYKINVFNK